MSKVENLSFCSETIFVSFFIFAFFSTLLKSSLYVKNISLSLVTYIENSFSQFVICLSNVLMVNVVIEKVIFRYLNLSIFNLSCS